MNSQFSHSSNKTALNKKKKKPQTVNSVCILNEIKVKEHQIEISTVLLFILLDHQKHKAQQGKSTFRGVTCSLALRPN